MPKHFFNKKLRETSNPLEIVSFIFKKEFTDFSITPQHLGVIVRDITRKRTSKRLETVKKQ